MARGGGGRRGRAAADAEPGRLTLVRRRSGTSFGLIVGVERRRHRDLIQVLLAQGGTVQMKEGTVKPVFWQPPPLHGPRDWEPRPRGLTEQMARLSVPDMIEREKSHGPEGALAAIECHRCPWGSQSRCEQAWKGLDGVERQLAQKREMLDAFRNAYWQAFLRVGEVLERFPAGGGHEGDLIRALRRLIDVLRQLAESPEVQPALAGLLSRASRVIDRGIVLESALI